jgi:ubiquinone/menaquinone biosynthesis C-methylase UbiE
MKHMDYIYFEEDYYKNKKDMFSFLIDILKKHTKDNFSLLDLGCSRGELLYHIQNDMPNHSKLFGLDYSEDLIKNAKEQDFLNDIDFKVGDVKLPPILGQQLKTIFCA